MGDGGGGGMPGAQSTGKFNFIGPGLYEASCGFHHTVSADDEGSIDQGKFLNGLVHKGVEDAAVFLAVTVKGVEHQLLGSLDNFLVVPENEHRPDGFSFPASSGEIGGDGGEPLKRFSSHPGGKHLIPLTNNGFEFLVHIHHQNGVELTASGDAPDAADTVLKAEDSTGESEENSGP
tara:strand:- start:27 stop:557 length:531 start_codon:yes stop_codon:yes gene_type:complete